jgi:hypothetical protein
MIRINPFIQEQISNPQGTTAPEHHAIYSTNMYGGVEI